MGMDGAPLLFKRRVYEALSKYIAKVHILTSFFADAFSQTAFKYLLALIGTVGVKPLTLKVQFSDHWTSTTHLNELK